MGIIKQIDVIFHHTEIINLLSMIYVKQLNINTTSFNVSVHW